MDYTVHQILQARILEWVSSPLSRGSSNLRIEPPSAARQADSLAEPQGKPENTGVESLSLFHGIVPTQELNWGLRHCRCILYQLSIREAPIVFVKVKGKSKVAQSCPTLCDPVDCSLPGSSIHGIFQASILEWVAISSSRGSSWPWDRTWVSHVVGRWFTIWATRKVFQTQFRNAASY